MKTVSAFLTIALYGIIVFASAEIKLEGFVPSGIDAGQLQIEYNRIWKTINPAKAQNAGAPIVVSYYVRSMQQGPSPLPEWGGGGALSANHIIVPVDGPLLLNLTLYQVTVHELTHCALMRAYPRIAVPRWFHEGVAMTLSGELSMTEQEAVSRAILFGGLFPLATIDSVNGFSSLRAQAAYAQSHLAVLFLIDTYGIRVVPQVLQAAGSSGNFWAGVDSVISLSPKEFETAFKNYLNDKYRFLFLFADNYLFWLGIVGLFLVGLMVTMKRNKRRMIKLAQQEIREDLKLQKLLEEENVPQNLPEQPPETPHKTNEKPG